MKRLIGMILLIVLCSAGLTAQDIVFGVKGGLNLGWFSGNNWDDYVESAEVYYGIDIKEQLHPALHAGLYLESMLSPNIGIVTELNFTQYGQDYEYSYAGIDVEGKYSINAIEVPVLLKIAARPVGGFYGLAGPTIVLLPGDLEFEESGGGVTVEGSQTPDNPIVLGLTAGVGYGFIMNQGVLSLEARYGRNLTDAFDADKDPFDVNSFKLLLGYGFVL